MLADLGTRDRLVTVTGELMRQHGYAATGIKAILSRSGAPSGSLYHFFPGGKEELAAEAISSAGAAYRDLVASYFQPTADPCRAAVAFFDDAADMLESTDFVDACPIAAIALETASSSPVLRVAAAEAFESWLAVIRRCAIASGATTSDADELAESLFVLMQGAFVLARTNQDAAPLRRAGATAARLALTCCRRNDVPVDVEVNTQRRGEL
jgi:AcrR family transcriptional regulator